MPRSNRAALPTVAAALLSSPLLAAAEPDEAGAARSGPDREDAALETVVVSASRVAVSRDEVGASISVVTAEDLELRQPTFVSDALRDVPGVAVSRGGGFGAVTQVRMRGAEGNHSLVLIDGVEANNPVSNSEFDFANLLVADIERIEILRGAQSALYGSDAVGGVVNIITKERAGREARLTAEGGSYGTGAFGVSVGGGSERRSGGLSLTRLATDGENIARGGNERDGFENESLSLSGRTLVGESFSVKGNVRYIDSEQDFDSQDFSFPPSATQGLIVDDDVSSRLEQWFGRVEATADLARAVHRLGVSATSTENTFFDAAATTGSNAGRKTKLDYQMTLGLGAPGDAAGGAAQALTLALERELVDYENAGATPDALENQKRTDEQTSVVAEYRASVAGAAFSVSARFDDNELFDDASTYRLTGAWSLADRTRLHASVGTAVANPGFFDLFGFFPGSYVGNPALAPERSTNFDIGVERRLGESVRLDATYFRANLEDEIVTTFDSTTFLASVTNLDGESERRGVELGISAAVGRRAEIAASYTYTDAAQPDGLAELRRPRHVASLDHSMSLLDGRAHLNVGVDYTGAQADAELVFASPEERVELPAFTVVNVAGAYDVSSRLRVYGRVENLLDEAYEEWFSYRARGRAVVAGFAVDFAP